mgnify:CR=1 FL=1
MLLEFQMVCSIQDFYLDLLCCSIMYPLFKEYLEAARPVVRLSYILIIAYFI